VAAIIASVIAGVLIAVVLIGAAVFTVACLKHDRDHDGLP
jgi:hypothetical protein